MQHTLQHLRSRWQQDPLTACVSKCLKQIKKFLDVRVPEISRIREISQRVGGHTVCAPCESTLAESNLDVRWSFRPSEHGNESGDKGSSSHELPRISPVRGKDRHCDILENGEVGVPKIVKGQVREVPDNDLFLIGVEVQ